MAWLLAKYMVSFFFFSLTKYSFFFEPWCFPWSHCWMQTTWKSWAVLCCSKRHGASLEASFNKRPRMSAQSCVGQALVWLQYFERHLQDFPGGLFQEVFLLRWREKTCCKLWARSNMFCSVALCPVQSAEVCRSLQSNGSDEFLWWIPHMRCVESYPLYAGLEQESVAAFMNSLMTDSPNPRVHWPKTHSCWGQQVWRFKTLPVCNPQHSCLHWSCLMRFWQTWLWRDLFWTSEGGGCPVL